MKMFIIVYWCAVDDEVIAALTKSGVKSYTKWTKVLGRGTETEPKMGLGHRSGENCVLFIVVNSEDADKVKEVVLSLREERPYAGIRCCVVPVEEIIE